MTRTLEPGHDGLGWWARAGNIPLGYLDDEGKSAETFPRRGRRALLGTGRQGAPAGGTTRLELHGRESVTINSGGEKIFAEEVEQALKHHDAVFDAVVAGRPSETLGQTKWSPSSG